MTNVVTINQKALYPAVVRWAKLDREAKLRVMDGKQSYNCKLRYTKDGKERVVTVRFFLTLVRVDTPEKSWKCDMATALSGAVRFI